MPQDFAKKKRSNTRPSQPRKRKKATPKSQVPGWVWLLTGTVLGAFIMFLTYLSGLNSHQGPVDIKSAIAELAPKKASQQAPGSQEQANIPDKTTSKPRFDFYQILQESEAKLPTDQQRTQTAQAPDKEYILQVGSFKSAEDADRLRAELIMMNLEASTEKVNVRNGEIWHRVVVGPYQSRSKMSKARSTLISSNHQALVLKRKISG